MPPKIGSSTAPIGDHFPARGNDATHGSTPLPPPSTRAGLRGNETLRGALAQRARTDAGPASAGAAGLRRTNSMSRLADFSRAALERQTSLPTTSRERQQLGSLLTTRDLERPAENEHAGGETPAKPSLKLGGSTPKPKPDADAKPSADVKPSADAKPSARPQQAAQSASTPHASTAAPAPAPAYGYPVHSPYLHAPTYQTHQYGAHRPIGFSYGHGSDGFGGTHAHVGFHYFGRHHTFRFSMSDSMASFWKGFSSGLLRPVLYHGPSPTSYAGYGAYAPPYAGHHYHGGYGGYGGYAGHHPYAIGYPQPYAMGYPAGASR